MRNLDLNDTVLRMKREILEDVAMGRVPVTVKTFAKLHDHVDANTYGGFCDDKGRSEIEAAFAGAVEDGTISDGLMNFSNAAQDAVHAWISSGQMAKEADTSLLAMPAISQGPWSSEATLSSDVRNIRRILNQDGVLVATVALDPGMEQEEALANAKAIRALPSTLEFALLVEQLLRVHPEFSVANSKVHFLVHNARSLIAQLR